MKILKKIILWSFIICALGAFLAVLTKSEVFFYVFCIGAGVLVIGIAVLLFGGEYISNSEAKSTYEAFMQSNLKSGYDRDSEITYSGKWHSLSSKDETKVLFIKTDAETSEEIEIKDFCITNYIHNKEGLVAVDNVRKKFLLYNFDDINPSYVALPYASLLSVAIITDGVMVSEKSTMRTVGGALVGGALFGGAGAVVGGLSGDSKQGQMIGRVSVKFVLRDVTSPTFEIVFLNMMQVKPSDSDYYKVEMALDVANKVKDFASIIIDEVDRSEKAPQVQNNNSSVADELAKLADLKAKGILTEEEFQAQKAKLLG